MKRYIIIAAAAALQAVTAGARDWTLRECIDYAVAHNISIREKDNARKQREIQLSTDRNSMLPGVEATVGQNFSFGRGLTSQNTYTNTNTSNTSFSIVASMPLFTGMRVTNAIRQSRLNLEAATADLEKARDDVSLGVAEAYVQILYDMEIEDVARRQVAIDSMQVARLEAMAGSGKASMAEVSQQKAVLAQSRLTATQAANNRRLSVLALSQLLELPSPDGFSIVRPDVASLAVDREGIVAPDVIYAEAVGMRPEVKAGEIRLRGADNGVSIARSALFPQLSLSAGLGTNYYKTSGFQADAFSSQIKNNFSQYVGLSLSVTVFNRFQTRNSVRSAKIDRETQALALENVKKGLYKEVQQVYYNAVAAAEKYESSRAAVRSGEDAFVLMTAKYENGKANITEFNEAKNNFLKAQSDMVQARYEYVYRCSLISFYRGRQLSL